MLSLTKLAELRGKLEASQNPIFLYDNDADGFCSYALLRRFLGRGKGIAVRTHPDIDAGYARRALSLGADLVVVLDCPFLGEAFVAEIMQASLSILWIDHHAVDSPHYSHSSISVFNPALNKGRARSAEPVTYLCYRMTKRKEDMWIAMMGCISDHYLPSFSRTFAKQFPEFWGNVKKPFDAYYGTEIGLRARVIGFGWKDSISHVVYLQNFVIACKTPSDMFQEIASESSFAQAYKDKKKKYDVLLAEARNFVEDKLIFFSYGGTLSISSDLANELSHIYPEKYIIVAYNGGGFCNISLRGSGVRKILNNILPLLEHASGGGHADAVGARIKADDLLKFKELFKKELSNHL